jgi:hypothetical protein
MKKIFFLIILFSLFFNQTRQAQAQSLSAVDTTETNFSSSELPQWVKDVRRFDIITFGIFPFSMFFVTFATDMIRWNNANGFDISEQGRQYAPWPAKSAGAVEMSNDEYSRTILLAAGVSVAVAIVDLLIVTAKRKNERRRVESRPSGSYEITKTGYGEPETDGFTAAEGGGETDTENNIETDEK